MKIYEIPILHYLYKSISLVEYLTSFSDLSVACSNEPNKSLFRMAEWQNDKITPLLINRSYTKFH